TVGKRRRQQVGLQYRVQLDASRRLDHGDAPDLSRRLREFAKVVGDLDPVPGVEAQHVVATEALQLKLVIGNDAGDTAADAGVLARPFEGGRGPGLAGIVNLDA